MCMKTDSIYQISQRWCTTVLEQRYVCTHFQGGAIIAPPCWTSPMHHSVEMSLAFCTLKLLSHGRGR